MNSPLRSSRAEFRTADGTLMFIDECQLEWTWDSPQPATGPIAAGSIAFDITLPFDRATSHALALATARAYRLRPTDLGINLRCACHPLPNPAARDYRRRTRHRNRRHP